MKIRFILVGLIFLTTHTIATAQNAKAPTRVLLVADGPTREYQFVRSAFVRNPEKIQLSILLQRATVESEQDVKPERMLSAFPALEGRAWPADFDLIIAFDADWTADSKARKQALHRWVHDQGGGLVIVAGPVSNLMLAHPTSYGASIISKLLPVRVGDPRLRGDRAPRSDSPHVIRLLDPSHPLIKLGADEKETIAAWHKFQWDDEDSRDVPPRRGFYSAVPSSVAEPPAEVIMSITESGRFTYPMIVTKPYGKGRVVFLASGELWRLRAYRQEYHVQIWNNIVQYATRMLDVTARSRLFVPDLVVEEDALHVEAILVDGKDKPLTSVKPALRLNSDNGVASSQMTSIREGHFQGQVNAGKPGSYTIEVEAPGMKAKLSATRMVKSYSQAHKEDRVFLWRQHDLLRRYTEAATDLQTMSNQGTLREAYHLTLKGHLVRRHEKLAADIEKASKLLDYENAAEDSKVLEEITRTVCDQLAGVKSKESEHFLVVFTRLASEQTRQTIALTQLKKQIEADLLKQLLDGK